MMSVSARMTLWYRGLLTLLPVLMCMGGLAAPVMAQIEFTVDVALLRINEEKRLDFAHLPQMLNDYMNSYRWVEGDMPRPLTGDLRIHIKSYSSGFEEVMSADFFLTFSNGRVYSDRHWTFPIKKDDVISHDRIEFSPFLDLIDHYVYLALGEEFDEWGSYAGESFLKYSLDLAAQGEFSHRYSSWWDKRKEYVQWLLSEGNKPFRNMVAHFRQALTLVNHKNTNDAPEFIHKTFQLVASLVETDDLRREDQLKEFFRLYGKAMLELAKFVNEPGYIDFLVQWDPPNADFYESNRL